MNSGFQISLAAAAADTASGPITLFGLSLGLAVGAMWSALVFFIWYSEGGT